MTVDEAAKTDTKAKKNGGNGGEGPGKAYMPAAAIAVVAAYLILVTLLAFYTIVKLWPHPTPTTATSTSVPPTSTATAPTTTTATATGTAVTTTATTTTAATKKTPEEERKEKREREIADRAKALCGPCAEREQLLQSQSKQPNDPQCTYLFGCWVIIWQEQRLLLLVLLAGAIGSLLHALRSLVAHVGNRNAKASWLAFYGLSPFIGATLAFVAYVVVRGGFFSPTGTTADANTFMFVALGALSGLFSQQVLEKLRKVAESAFDKPAGAKDGLQKRPVIAKITPDSVDAGSQEVEITIEGSDFADGAEVHAGSEKLVASDLSEKKLTFKLPATLTAAEGEIKITVKNPGGDPSEAKSIKVKPK